MDWKYSFDEPEYGNCCGRNGRTSELAGMEMVVKDCGGDKAQDSVMVSSCCGLKALAVGAKEVKEWERPGCWTNASFFH